MGGSVAVTGVLAPGGSFLGTAVLGTAATACGLAVADGAGFCGLVGLPTGRVGLAAELGERGTTCVRNAGVPGCCDPASVPVRICAGFCMPMAERPNRAQKLQIVRENRNIAVSKYLEILLDFTPPMVRTAAQNILARLISGLSARSRWNIVINRGMGSLP